MRESTAHLHLICEDWTRTLQFYKSEIPFFKKRLEEISIKNTAEEIRKEVEHFENIYILMNENLDEILHNVNLKEDEIMKDAKEQPEFINLKVRETVDELKDVVDFIVQDFATKKKSFFRFLSDHL